MRTIHETSQFRRDIKKLKKQGKNLQKLKDVIDYLISGDKLEEKYRDHPLSGPWQGSRDCHIEQIGFKFTGRKRPIYFWNAQVATANFSRSDAPHWQCCLLPAQRPHAHVQDFIVSAFQFFPCHLSSE